MQGARGKLEHVVGHLEQDIMDEPLRPQMGLHNQVYSTSLLYTHFMEGG